MVAILEVLGGLSVTAQLDLLSPLGRGLRKRDASAAKHSAELDRLIPVIRKLAAAGATDLEAVRRHEGWLESKGRELSWLGALPSRAGLVKAGMRRSTLPGSNGNWISTWRLP